MLIDRKLEPLIKRLMVKYLGEMEEEDLIMFVVEHLKDHKSPHKLIEGLEAVRTLFFLLHILVLICLFLHQVLEEESIEFTVNLWRQIIFESMAYNEGLVTEKTLVDWPFSVWNSMTASWKWGKVTKWVPGFLFLFFVAMGEAGALRGTLVRFVSAEYALYGLSDNTCIIEEN